MYKPTNKQIQTITIRHSTQSGRRDLQHLTACSSFCSASLTSICEYIQKMLCAAVEGLMYSWSKEKNRASVLDTTY